jgi:predicted aspartyl protease
MPIIPTGIPSVNPPLQAAADAPVNLGQLQEFTVDNTRRMTVPVKVNGSAAYPFIVDTGSERTVIANDLASALGLESGKPLRLATVTGPATVPSFLIESLSTSTIQLDSVEAPGLDRKDLGAFGLLGIDSLADKQLSLNFRDGTMLLLASPRKRTKNPRDSGTIVVSARRRAGRLILSDARLNGLHVDIVIDTGAQSSLGNFALRDKLLRRNRGRDFMPVQMSSVVGAQLSGDFTQIREIELGGIKINDMPIVFSENYAARVLGLDNKPAIFLGMDALSLFDLVVIDFVNNRVSFSLPRAGQRSTR